MRQEPRPLDEYRDLTGEALVYAKRLITLRTTIARARAELYETLALCLSPDMDDMKLMSYRLAGQLSGVSHETLRRQFS